MKFASRRARRGSRPAPSALLLASVAVGCSDGAAGPDGSSVDALVGVEWELISIRRGSDTLRPVESFAPSVVFTDEESPSIDGYLVVGGSGGCNGMGGGWRSLQPGELEIRQLAATEKFCLPVGVNAFESQFLEAFAESHGFRVDDDRLVLSFVGGILAFRRAAPAEGGS